MKEFLITSLSQMHEKGENGNNMTESRDQELRGNTRGFERVRFPLCLGEGDPKHILQKCSETKNVEGRLCKQQLA
jgi:hypothetical protein